MSAAHSRSCWCRQLWHIVGLDSISACKTLTLMLASKVVSLAAADRTVSPIARASLPRVLLGAGSTAALLQLSAVLYSSGVPYLAIHAALAVCALGCWAAFDGSLQVHAACGAWRST